MKLKSIGLFLLLFNSFIISLAQVKTVELDEVVIEALPFEKFTSGSKIVKSDSLSMAILEQKTLADYMQQNTTVYIKEAGNKMLASVSFRGTGASHTGVFWHGINLNSMTLGNSDFNGYPLFLFDDVVVQYGGASSLHGSDAIGGSIHLSSIPKWTKQKGLQIRQDVGSFGNFFTGAKVRFGNGKMESKTKIFNRLLQNNFQYKITDRLGDQHEVTQENAHVHNYGIIQEFNIKTSKTSYLALKGWFGRNEHQIQPMMITYPGQDQDSDELFDRNLRLNAEYEKFYSKGILLSSASYVWGYQLFNNTDLIETKRSLASLSYEWSLSERTLLKFGATGQYIVPNVWSYEDDLSEWRGDTFVSLNQAISQMWDLNINIRKTFIPFTNAPIAPSLSTNYKIGNDNTLLSFRAQVERSYRVPTFNDRYWGVQGRPDLKSEQGYSVELGHNFQQQLFDGSLEVDLSGYFMIVDDWIAWKPTGILWRPFNLKKVEASGIEFNSKYRRKIKKGSLEIGGLYAYNRAVLLEGISDDDPAIGYQLPYTPKHRAVIFANLIFGNYRCSINNSYTGKRYGMDVINEEVDNFFLTDITLSKNIHFGKQTLSIEGQVLNLFDIEYQNVNRYAMPGRNYLLSINFFLNN